MRDERQAVRGQRVERWRASDWLKKDEKNIESQAEYDRRQTTNLGIPGLYPALNSPCMNNTTRFGPMAGLVGAFLLDFSIHQGSWVPLPFFRGAVKYTRVYSYQVRVQVLGKSKRFVFMVTYNELKLKISYWMLVSQQTNRLDMVLRVVWIMTAATNRVDEPDL